MSNPNKWYKTVSYYYNSTENFFFRRVFPILGVAFLLAVTTPLEKLIPWQLDVELQLSLLIFFSVAYGSKLLHATLSKGEKELLSFSSQESAIENALSLIPKKGTNVDILIFTSFSLFSNLENLIKKFPQLGESYVRILIRDPDTNGYPCDTRLTKTRQRQLSTVLDSLVNNSSNSQNFDIRFYANEPWVRGIKIGNDDLIFSTYSNKSEFSKNEIGDGYSGSSTPWIQITSIVPNILPKEMEPAEQFLSSFDSLFNLIWEKCNSSRALILDLDGTLYKDDNANEYFYNKVPSIYFEYLIKEGNAKEQDFQKFLHGYNKYREDKCSGTVSIVNSAQDLYGNDVDLSLYLDWKDNNSLQHAECIAENKELADSIAIASNYYSVFILTNHTRKFTIKALDMLGLSSVINESNVITANDLGCIKPDPDILAILVQDYNIDLQSAVFVGDRDEIDFGYNKGIAQGTVLVKDTDKLPVFLKDCWLPYSWLYDNKSKYEGLELNARNSEKAQG